MTRGRFKLFLPRTILILGAVSFFTDVSSEMIYPLLPLFLSQVLNAGAIALGMIEGVAEATASLLKIISGRLSDRLQKRKILIASGYGLASLVRPLIGLATSWPIVLLLRFGDRVGKGIRTAPRDALIAESVPEGSRGHAYGFHRAMDHAGAVLGPLLAALLLGVAHIPLRHVFLIAAVPGLLAFLLVIFGLENDKPKKLQAPEKLRFETFWKTLNAKYKTLLAAIFIFNLGKASEAFLIFYLIKIGMPQSIVTLLWALYHIVKMLSTYFAGKFSDVWGYQKPIFGGWLFSAMIYVVFAFVQNHYVLVTAFIAYGIYFGLTEPAERALIAQSVKKEFTGTAFGVYHMMVGLAALPASLIFGVVWQKFGPPVAFMTSVVLAIIATILFASSAFGKKHRI